MSTALPTQLFDNQNRHITNMRISVTDRCNFRCIYCMPEEMTWYPRADILTFEEIQRVVQIVAGLGSDKIRLTGGEPTLRSDLPDLVRMIHEVDGIRDVGLTTNGFKLKQLAQPLYDAGLRRLNVSLDSLDRHKFHEMTRRDALDKVLDGLREAERVGFNPIKINAVTMRGRTEDEVLDFARLAMERAFKVRFIEFMPLDGDGIWGPDSYVPGREIIERIDAVYPLESIPTDRPEPATRYRFRNNGQGEIGIIPSVSEPFCESCNRIRITADGKLRTCLFSLGETDLREPLRNGASDENLAEIIVEAVRHKEPGHLINRADFVKPERSMSQIGG